MSGRQARTWRWQLSGYDERVHAFPADERPASFVEAACAHTVPFARISRTHAGPRCVRCLLIFGDQLAAAAGPPVD
ncbi:hypothetical protein [Actinokineospora enzanensis]|uniref:hypothetical protein n=1 Tax=Actinokineospora enzanensis TaxID=155975 RepID=UPI0003A0DE66|nr:hypothetical protein [Actinokineospora enzanensis]